MTQAIFRRDVQIDLNILLQTDTPTIETSATELVPALQNFEKLGALNNKTASILAECLDETSQRAELSRHPRYVIIKINP